MKGSQREIKFEGKDFWGFLYIIKVVDKELIVKEHGEAGCVESFELSFM